MATCHSAQAMTSAAPEVEPSEDFAIYLQPRRGRTVPKLLWLNLRWGPSKDLLVSTFSLEAGDSTPAAAAALVVEVEPSEDLAKTGALELPS